MTDLVKYTGNLPIQRKLGGELARRLGHMQDIAETAMAAEDEVSGIHTYTIFRGATTLDTSETLKRAAGELTPEQKEALQLMDQRYLNTLSQISDLSSAHIVRSVQDAAEDNRSDLQKIADWIIDR